MPFCVTRWRQLKTAWSNTEAAYGASRLPPERKKAPVHAIVSSFPRAFSSRKATRTGFFAQLGHRHRHRHELAGDLVALHLHHLGALEHRGVRGGPRALAVAEPPRPGREVQPQPHAQ